MQAHAPSRGYVVDPFIATPDWLRAVQKVWRRNDCLLCGECFQVGDRVRWLHANHPGVGTGYWLVHVECVVQDQGPPGGR